MTRGKQVKDLYMLPCDCSSAKKERYIWAEVARSRTEVPGQVL